MAQARQHSALMLLAVAASAAQAAPSAAACVAEHARAAQEESAEAGHAAFANCALREFGPAVEARIEACASELYTLPVILLYRVDGLGKSAALADLKREGQLDDGSDYARRAPLMLDFAYQGVGPAAGQVDAWIRQRTAQWADRCLRARTN